jgi:hypothetical protein
MYVIELVFVEKMQITDCHKRSYMQHPLITSLHIPVNQCSYPDYTGYKTNRGLVRQPLFKESTYLAGYG